MSTQSESLGGSEHALHRLLGVDQLDITAPGVVYWELSRRSR